MEIWKKVIEHNTTFFVSNLGSIKTPPRPHSYTRIRNGKEQTITRVRQAQHYTPQDHHSGYKEICLRQNGLRVRVKVHRLVAKAFCGGYEDGLVVNHINGIKEDNRAENLEWVSASRNSQHAWETGLVNLRGENQPTAKLTSKRVSYIRKLLNQGIPAHTISIVAGLSDATIHHIKTGKNWKGVDANTD